MAAAAAATASGTMLPRVPSCRRPSAAAIRPSSSAVVCSVARARFSSPTSRIGGPSLGCAKKCGAAAVVAARQQGQWQQQWQQGQELAARDRVMDFGRFKGTAMGTLSSGYLRWMVNNLGAGPLSEWSGYAEEVLADPYYRDRLEWETVEKLMISAHDVASSTGNREEVFAPARMYGWDLQDDAGWRKVNFSLIGTTKGGRIPRVRDGGYIVVPETKKAAPRMMTNSIPARTAVSPGSSLSTRSTSSDVDDARPSGSSRDEVMRRRAKRRHRLMARRGLLAGTDEAAEA